MFLHEHGGLDLKEPKVSGVRGLVEIAIGSTRLLGVLSSVAPARLRDLDATDTAVRVARVRSEVGIGCKLGVARVKQ